MTDRLIHPREFTVQGQTLLTEYGVAASDMEHGFAVVRGALGEEAVSDMQKVAIATCEALDQNDGWKRYRRGWAKNIEQTEIAADGFGLTQCIGELATQFNSHAEVITRQLLRYNRRSGTGRIGESAAVWRADVSLLGRMTFDVWQGADRKALMTLRPGDALIVHGGRGMPKHRSWNTTKVVDSDEHARRLGLVFHYTEQNVTG